MNKARERPGAFSQAINYNWPTSDVPIPYWPENTTVRQFIAIIVKEKTGILRNPKRFFRPQAVAISRFMSPAEIVRVGFRRKGKITESSPVRLLQIGFRDGFAVSYQLSCLDLQAVAGQAHDALRFFYYIH